MGTSTASPEVDIPEQGGRIRNTATLRRWMTAYAAATATTMSLELIRRAATGTTEPARSIDGPLSTSAGLKPFEGQGKAPMTSLSTGSSAWTSQITSPLV